MPQLPSINSIVITKTINVSVTVNPPVCERFLILMIFLMPKYNYCCYAWIFKFNVFPPKKQIIIFFIKKLQ